MKKFTIDRKDFEGEEFNCIMASGDGRRLWVSYCDGSHYFKIENLKTGKIVLETFSFNKAIRTFNEL